MMNPDRRFIPDPYDERKMLGHIDLSDDGRFVVFKHEGPLRYRIAVRYGTYRTLDEAVCALDL